MPKIIMFYLCSFHIYKEKACVRLIVPHGTIATIVYGIWNWTSILHCPPGGLFKDGSRMSSTRCMATGQWTNPVPTCVCKYKERHDI